MIFNTNYEKCITKEIYSLKKHIRKIMINEAIIKDNIYDKKYILQSLLKLKQNDLVKIKGGVLNNKISSSKNIQLSKLTPSELKTILHYLDSYYITLKDKLNIDKNINIGIELEFAYTNYYSLQRKINKYYGMKGWVMKNDTSLNDGGEINSPKLNDNKGTWNDLKNICNMIKKESIIDESCGAHIHIGNDILNNNPLYFKRFINLLIAYENLLFRFSYGENLNNRKDIGKYASPVAGIFDEMYKDLLLLSDFEKIRNNVAIKRKQAINFGYKSNNETIEFRIPNGTLNPIIWQNNINVFVKLLEYSKNPNYDLQRISKRREINRFMFDNLELYNNINLDEALEFSDLIFNNNTDKFNFLKQYLKSYKYGNYKKVKKITS